MTGHSVRRFVASDYYDPGPDRSVVMRGLQQEYARREDQRLVRIVADTAGLPFPVTVAYLPDLHMLEVRVPGHALATVTREYAARCSDPDTMAVHLGRQARRAWFRTPALPLPRGVVLGEN